MKRTSPQPSSQPALLTCGVCGRRFYLDKTETPPFCSERCKLIDLGRWLDEEIEIPHEGGPSTGEHHETDE